MEYPQANPNATPADSSLFCRRSANITRSYAYFIGSLISETREPPYSAWMRTHISPTAFALKTQDPRTIFYGVLNGLGIGFLAEHEAAAYPELVRIVPPQAERAGHLWIVTHVDLHQTSKVQAFIKLLWDSTGTLN